MRCCGVAASVTRWKCKMWSQMRLPMGLRQFWMKKGARTEVMDGQALRMMIVRAGVTIWSKGAE